MTERCGGGCVRPIGHAGGCRETWHAYERCGAWMRYARERCARRRGHLTEHRTTEALENRRMADAA